MAFELVTIKGNLAGTAHRKPNPIRLGAIFEAERDAVDLHDPGGVLQKHSGNPLAKLRGCVLGAIHNIIRALAAGAKIAGSA